MRRVNRLMEQANIAQAPQLNPYATPYGFPAYAAQNNVSNSGFNPYQGGPPQHQYFNRGPQDGYNNNNGYYPNNGGQQYQGSPYNPNQYQTQGIPAQPSLDPQSSFASMNPTTAAPGFPFNLFAPPTTTTAAPRPFPFNLLPDPPTTTQAPFPFNLFPTTAAPFPFG